MAQPLAEAPFDLREVARHRHRELESFSSAAARVATKMWDDIDPRRIVDSWSAKIPELTTVVSGAQLGAARQADDYLSEALQAQDIDDTAGQVVNPEAFSGTASDGRGLMGLLTNPVVVVLGSIADGVDVTRALFSGRANLDMLVRTQVSDAGRLADQASLVAHEGATGYVRMTDGNPCARCLILAGRTYRWNRGFLRHPRCGCVHVPTLVANPRWQNIDPRDLYDAMTPVERLRAGFSRADQAAIDAGADINQIVNARRGVYTAGGKRFTTEGTTRRGLFGQSARRRVARGERIPPRKTPDQIFADAATREEAIAELVRYRYLIETPRPAVGRAQELARLEREHAERIAALERRHADRLAELGAGRGERLARIEREHAQRVAELEAAHQARLAALDRGLVARTVPSDLPGPRSAIPPVAPGLEVRSVLAQAQDIEQIQFAFWRETRRIRGVDRPVPGLFAGMSEDTAREYAEGILRGLERFPDVKMLGVGLENEGLIVYAQTVGKHIEFSPLFSSARNRDLFLGKLRRDVQQGFHVPGSASPVAVSIHEFGHIVSFSMTREAREALRLEVDGILRRQGADRLAVVRAHVSEYATRDFEELLADAFTDVMINGERASVVSREIFQALERKYHASIGLPSVSDLAGFTRPAPAQLSIAALTTRARAAGITVPTGLRKPALVRLVDDLDSGLSPAVARERAVRTILEEREAVAGALREVSELIANQGSARAMAAVGRRLRTALDADAAKVAKPLLDALDAGDVARVQAALGSVARSAKLKPIGAPGDVVRIDRTKMSAISEASDAPVVRVIRPGYETTFERRTILVSRADVVEATPEQAARLAPAKAAKKAAPLKATPDLTGARSLSADPAVRAVQVENRIRQAYRDVAGTGDFAMLSDIRAHPALRGLNRPEVDSALRRLEQQRDEFGANIVPQSNQKALSAADRDAAIVIGNQAKHAISFDDASLRPLPKTAVKKATPAKKAAAPAKKATAAAKAAKKIAAPKPPPAPERLSIPALKTEVQRALDIAGSRLDLAGVPKPQLVAWTRRARELKPDQLAEEVGRWRQVVIDRRRDLADLLSEADELVANGGSAAAMGARGAARVKRWEQAAKDWPELAEARKVVTAMATGDPAKIRRAIAAARRKVGLEQTGVDAGKLTKYDPKAMSPIGGKIADGADVIVVRPGYSVTVGGERVVISKPVVEVADPVEARAAALSDLADRTPTASRELGGGAMAEVQLLEFDGERVVEKVYSNFVGPRAAQDLADIIDAELLAPHVLEALGIRAPIVVRAGDGRVLMEYVEDMPWKEVGRRFGRGSTFAAEDAIVDSAEGRRLGLADLLMDNRDRNGGNWLIDTSGRLVAIDHGEAFVRRFGTSWEGQFTDYLLGRRAITELTRAEIAEIRTRLEALAPRFKAAGRLSWHRAMMRRLAAIEKRVVE